MQQHSEPWIEITEQEQRAVIEAELRQETGAYAAAFYSQALVLARRFDRDDFLFHTKNAQWPYAIVHLTFSGKAESQPYPIAILFKDLASVETKLAQDALDFHI